jgi:hypothetical protein
MAEKGLYAVVKVAMVENEVEKEKIWTFQTVSLMAHFKVNFSFCIYL